MNTATARNPKMEMGVPRPLIRTVPGDSNGRRSLTRARVQARKGSPRSAQFRDGPRRGHEHGRGSIPRRQFGHRRKGN